MDYHFVFEEEIMKVITVLGLFLVAAALLFPQQEIKVRPGGENFTYAALECTGSYAQFGAKMGELMQELGKQKIDAEGGPMAIYWNSSAQVKEEELKWEIGIPVAADTQVEVPLKKKEYKFDLVVETFYKGPYGSAGQAYGPIMEFIAKNGYMVNGPISESYMDDPSTVKPEECRTLIVVPVAKKQGQ